MADFKILPCAKRWNYPSIDLSSRMVRTCVRGFGPVVGKEDVEKYGTDIFINHPYMKKGRELMLQGKFQWDCRGCYEHLKNGFDGFRTPYPETLSYLAKSYGESEKETETNFKCGDQKYLTSQSVKELEVGFGNLCDMKCLYCTSDWSSMIEAEEMKTGQSGNIYYRTPIEENKDFLDVFWKWMEETAVHQVEHVHLIGGETLFNKYFFVFMAKFDQIYRSQNLSHEIQMNIFTNLNNEASIQRLLQVLQGTHPNIKINLLFSNEATGKKSEFIRNGLGWDRVLKNLDAILKNGKVKVSFAPSFNSLSLTSIVEYFQFVKEFSERFGSTVYVGDNYIADPQWLAPSVLTHDYCHYLDEAVAYLDKHGESFLPDYNVVKLKILFSSLKESILKNEELIDLKKRRQSFYRNVMNLQKVRGLDFKANFPDYQAFLLKCKEAYIPV